MGRFAFLLSRRWVLFLLTVIVLCTAAVLLGQWQFDRLAARQANNEIVRTNEVRNPDPIEDVLRIGKAPRKDDEWRLVTVTGTYALAEALVWRYRSDPRTEQAGVDMVVPLITSDGTRVLINRGFVGTDGREGLATFPEHPSGSVTITGYVRRDGDGKSTRIDSEGNTRALSSVAFSEHTGATTYGGWIQLKSEDPAPSVAPTIYPLPKLDNGPHFFYGIQWWFFGLLAIVGFFYLLWDEYKLAQAGVRGETSEGVNEDPESADPDGVDREAGLSGTGRLQPAAKSAKALAREEKLARKKALKAAYQAAYSQEKTNSRG